MRKTKTKDELPECPVATAVSLIGGEVEASYTAQPQSAPWRFNELLRDLDGISQKVLTDSLRQMIDDGLAYRHDYRELPPKFVQYLGKVLPCAAIGLLVVYCFKDVASSGTYSIPEILSVLLIIVLHKWKKNTLLSIGGGTALYMLLVQTVFK